MPQIITMPMRFRIASNRDKPRWDLFLMGDVAERLATIAVYDLELYLAHQRELAKKGGAGPFETDERAFTGKGSLKGLPVDHRVGPGTGVLLTCDVVFERHKKRVSGFDWYVHEVKDRKENPPGSRAFSLEVCAHARIDAGGKPVSKGPFPMQKIGTAALPQDDSGVMPIVPRPLVVRVLTSKGKVLLSSLDRGQAKAGPHKTAEGRWKNVAQYSLALLRWDAVPPEPGTKPPAEPQPDNPRRRLVSPDPTGFWVLDADGLKLAKQTQLQEPRVRRLVSPAGLWLHAAGRVISGWYHPVPDAMLDSPLLFSSDMRAKLPNRNRVVFFSYPDLRPPAGADAPEVPSGARRLVWLSASRHGHGIDPTDMLPSIAGAAGPSVGWGWLRVKADLVELSLGDDPWTFRLAYEGTRLAWGVVRRMLSQPAMQGLGPKVAALAIADAEPIPPGTHTYMLQKTFGDVMDAISTYAKRKSATVVDPMAVEDAVEDLNGTLLTLLQTSGVERKEEVIARARGELLRRTVHIAGSNRVTWDVLTEIVGDVMEHRISQARTLDSEFVEPTPALAYDKYIRALAANRRPRMNGFVGLGVNPSTRRYRYKLEFFTLGISGGVYLKGATGGFRVKVTKSIVTVENGKQVERPDTSFHKGGATMPLYGWYFGGGAGLSAGYDISVGRKSGGAGAGGPVDCVFDSSADIKDSSFVFSTFTTFAQVKPGYEIKAIGDIGIASAWFDLVFELDVGGHKPPAVLTTVVKKADPLGPKLPNTDTIKSLIKQIKQGDLEKVDTVAVNFTLYGLTASKGWFLLGFPGKEVKPPPKDRTPESLQFDVKQRLNVAAFHRGKHSFLRGHENYLDATLSVHRRLLTMNGWFTIEGMASPEWGDLDKDAAATKNEDLSRYRALEVRNQIFAALGGVGQGVLPAGEGPKAIGKGAAPFREMFSSSPEQGQLLDPFSGAAKTPEGKKRVREEQAGPYRFMRRVDLAANGVYFMSLPES